MGSNPTSFSMFVNILEFYLTIKFAITGVAPKYNIYIDCYSSTIDKLKSSIAKDAIIISNLKENAQNDLTLINSLRSVIQENLAVINNLREAAQNNSPIVLKGASMLNTGANIITQGGTLDFNTLFFKTAAITVELDQRAQEIGKGTMYLINNREVAFTDLASKRKQFNLLINMLVNDLLSGDKTHFTKVVKEINTVKIQLEEAQKLAANSQSAFNDCTNSVALLGGVREQLS